jgi:hypothetical protein
MPAVNYDRMIQATLGVKAHIASAIDFNLGVQKQKEIAQ